jgi:Tubulin-tyrosine ligase family
VTAIAAGSTTSVAATLLQQVKELLTQLQLHHPQSCIDGERNIWILKPAAKSRGRGISCSNSLKEIQASTTEGGVWLALQIVCWLDAHVQQTYLVSSMLNWPSFTDSEALVLPLSKGGLCM